MASPTVVTTSVGGSTGATSHVITLPSGIVSGDLVIVNFKMAELDGGNVWPAGWQVFAGHGLTQIAYRDADGTEGASITIVSLNDTWSSYICYRISGHADPATQLPEGPSILPTGYSGLTSPESYTALLAISERNLEAASEDPGVFTYPTSHDWLAATIAIHPSGSVFPVIEGRNCSRTISKSTSHTVLLPASIASGETLIVMFMMADGGGSISFPSGWTIFHNVYNDPPDGRMNFAWRKADGAEGASITVTSTGDAFAAHASYRISGATDPTVTPPESSTGATGASATPDPDSLSPSGGSKKYLWFAVVGNRLNATYPSAGATGNSTTPDPPSLSPTGGSKDYLFIAYAGYDSNQDASSGPTNYSNLLVASEYETGSASAERALTAASDDPDTFTFGTADAWQALTIAIHPGAVAVSQTFIGAQESLIEVRQTA